MRLVHLKDKVGVGCDCLMQGEQEWKGGSWVWRGGQGPQGRRKNFKDSLSILEKSRQDDL